MYEPLNRKDKTMKKTSKYGRNPKLNPKTHCVMVRFDDRDIGEDFTDLPDLNSRKNKGAITVRFELSPCFLSFYIPDFKN